MWPRAAHEKFNELYKYTATQTHHRGAWHGMKGWCAVCEFFNVTESTSDPPNAVPTLHSLTIARTNPTTTDQIPARAFPSRKASAGDQTETKRRASGPPAVPRGNGIGALMENDTIPRKPVVTEGRAQYSFKLHAQPMVGQRLSIYAYIGLRSVSGGRSCSGWVDVLFGTTVVLTC